METIPRYYSDKDILVTGGSGFMGKVLIEKLLRSCPDLNRIFVLIRAKNGRPISERIQEILNVPLFDLVREKNPKILEKVVGVEGDIMSTDLGLTQNSFELLKNVSIIFHSAASVKFDDPLKYAVILNTRGTRDVCEFATTLKNLEAFVYVSTTYCNPDYNFIEEKIYPPHGKWQEVIRIAEKIDPDILQILMAKFTDHSPNTYTYSKGLGEQICKDYKNRLPIVIFRPSIVTGSEREPVPGWIDNINGPVGMLVACGFGVLRTNYASSNAILNCIAVDVAIKAMIASAWELGSGNQQKQKVSSLPQQVPEKTNNIKVFNCASLHNVSMGFLIGNGKVFFRKMPFEKTLWHVDGSVTTCKFMNNMRWLLWQIIPALLVDTVLKLSGRKPMLTRLQRKIYHALLALRIFVNTEWKIVNDNFVELGNIILPADKESFSLERSVKSTDEYYTYQILGARRYILKQQDSTIPECKVKYEKIVLMNRLIKITFWVFVVYFLVSRFILPRMIDPILVLGNRDPHEY